MVIANPVPQGMIYDGVQKSTFIDLVLVGPQSQVEGMVHSCSSVANLLAIVTCAGPEDLAPTRPVKVT